MLLGFQCHHAHFLSLLLLLQVFLLADDVADIAKQEVAWSTFGAPQACVVASSGRSLTMQSSTTFSFADHHERVIRRHLARRRGAERARHGRVRQPCCNSRQLARTKQHTRAAGRLAYATHRGG